MLRNISSSNEILIPTISRFDFMLKMFLKRNVATKRKDSAAELNVNFRLRLVLSLNYSL